MGLSLYECVQVLAIFITGQNWSELSERSDLNLNSFFASNMSKPGSPFVFSACICCYNGCDFNAITPGVKVSFVTAE